MHTGFDSSGPSGRRRCAAVSGSRGCTSECQVPGVAHRSSGVAHRASFPRPFRPPSVRGGVGFPGLHLGVPGLHTGLHSRGPSGRHRAGDRLARSRGCTPGLIPAAFRAAGERAVRWRICRGCTSEYRGCTPGFVPAALRAAGERAIDWRSPGVAPRASFPRPFGPPSVRGGVGFPGLHPGLCSCGHSGRRGFGEARGRVPEVSPADSRGCTPGFIPAAIQAAADLERREGGFPGFRRRIPGVAPRALFLRPFGPPESGRFGDGFPGVAPRSPGVAPRALFLRPFGPPESGRFGRGFPGVAPRSPGVAPRASFPRPFRPLNSSAGASPSRNHERPFRGAREPRFELSDRLARRILPGFLADRRCDCVGGGGCPAGS